MSQKTRKSFLSKESQSANTKKTTNQFVFNFDLAKLITLCAICGYIYSWHVETLFENTKFFSHLSNLERELAFRTENGLYYYYFKNLAVNKNLVPLNNSILGLINTKIIIDNRTEHPLTINSLQRFNLYPEILVAYFYRLFRYMNLLDRNCWSVDRSESNLPKIESCVGGLEPTLFYTKFVFILHGFCMAFFVFLCWSLNNKSILAGLIGCLTYFYNHGESTRVMWFPPLRESFSYPFHVLQLIALVNFIQSKDAKKTELFLIFSTLVYLLPWQFAQFSLATQAASIFATYSLGFLSYEKLFSFVKCQTLALIACFILMFANRMLMTSLFASLLCSIWILLLFEHKISKIRLVSRWKILFIALMRITALLFLIIISKKLILGKIFPHEDDSHIWDILKSKFDPSFFTFDTRLYTCAREFDFMDLETLSNVTITFLLPFACLHFTFYLCLIFRRVFILTKEENPLNSDLNDEIKHESVLLYNLFQIIAYTLMSGMILRLKLFWTPYLCIFVSYIANNYSQHNLIEQILNLLRVKNVLSSKYWVFALILGLMSFQGLQNLKKQHADQGEFSDPTMEAMMEWINKNTNKNDAFVGSMSIMANVKLSTDRPIVNHPHYEDIALRNRTKYIYSLMYGYRDVEELNLMLKNEFKASYLVIESHHCRSHQPGKPHCALREIAHLGFEKKTARQACDLIIEQNDDKIVKKLFKRVFIKNYLNVFKIL
jgi:hypothetical protein